MPSHLKDFPSPLSSPQRQDRPRNTPKIPQRTLSADLEECTAPGIPPGSTHEAHAVWGMRRTGPLFPSPLF